jgi:hypothetical protein
MRKISDSIKNFYVKRCWNDGDIDYFNVWSIDERLNRYNIKGEFYRLTPNSGWYLLRPDGSVFIIDSEKRFKDKKLLYYRYFREVNRFKLTNKNAF